MEHITLKTSIAHLPPSKQQELGIVKDIIRKHLPAKMIILFGSYARGDYVEQDYTQENGTTYGYASDFDILVVTNKRIETFDERWKKVEDTISSKPLLTPTTLINHDFFFFKAVVKHSQYFFVDIVNQGILLYAHDSDKYKLEAPKKLMPAKRLKKARQYVEYWMTKGDSFFKGFKFYTEEQDYSTAAFQLHQAVESYFAAFALVTTDYKPKTHDLDTLRKRAISINEAYREVFPVGTKKERRLFELLRKAYVGARYDRDYKITLEELQYLAERAVMQRALTEKLCKEDIAKLKKLL